ncbi:hypothetical protein BJX63DRAFT_430987 [Aspergillus granulosus]|uniref:Uncharacterized protein n=1 Tax=Aspergillus granulosus TaxID=176169 RepID=A0ABR4HI59_9EURO
MNPHMPPQHHPSTRPAEGPHPIHDNPSGSRNPDHLVDRLGRLHIQQDRLHEARSRSFNASAEVDEDTDPLYVGYTFVKARAAPGQHATWLRADRTKMNLSQNDLSALVQKNTKRKPAADQYHNIRKIRRTHVDELMEELREELPQYQWTCVYVKEQERYIRGKGYPRHAVETSSMDIILQGKALNPSEFRVSPVDGRDTFQFRDHRDQRPVRTPQHSSDEPRPFSRAGYAEQWREPGIQQAPTPLHIHGAQHASVPFHQQGPPHPQLPPHIQPQQQPHGAQQASAQFHQQGPLYPQPQSHAQLPPHAQSLPQQVNWAQNGPAGHAHHPQPQPVEHNHINSAPAYDPRAEVHDHRPRTAMRESESRNHRQQIPNLKSPHKNQVKAGKKRDKSPKHVTESEPDLVYDTTSSDDDNIPTPNYDGEGLEAEFSERDVKSSKTAPWRGSLYRGHPSSQPRRSYRQHYRKDPQRVDDPRVGRYRDDSLVDIIPASSSRSPRRLGRMPSAYRGTVGQYERQPNIIQHPQLSAEDIELMMRQLRGRAHNDVRSRMLDEWELELVDREEMLKCHQQMTACYDDNNYMGRSRSLRQPLTAYPYSHNYLQLH